MTTATATPVKEYQPLRFTELNRVLTWGELQAFFETHLNYNDWNDLEILKATCFNVLSGRPNKPEPFDFMRAAHEDNLRTLETLAYVVRESKRGDSKMDVAKHWLTVEIFEYSQKTTARDCLGQITVVVKEKLYEGDDPKWPNYVVCEDLLITKLERIYLHPDPNNLGPDFGQYTVFDNVHTSYSWSPCSYQYCVDLAAQLRIYAGTEAEEYYKGFLQYAAHILKYHENASIELEYDFLRESRKRGIKLEVTVYKDPGNLVTRAFSSVATFKHTFYRNGA